MGVNPSCCGPSELRSIGQDAERRGTDDERRKNFTTQVRQTPEPELDAAGRPQTAWIDDRKRWKTIGQLVLGHSRKSFTDGGLLAAVVPPVASSR